MITCITEGGVVTRLCPGQLPTGLLLELVQATYDHLASVLGEDHRGMGAAPGWTISTPDGIAHLDYCGRHATELTPRVFSDAVYNWAICGTDYAAAAWVTKVISRPSDLASIPA